MTRAAHLPARIPGFGPFMALTMQIHDLTVRGRCPEALDLADRLEPVIVGLGDIRSLAFVFQARAYALSALGRPQEALLALRQVLELHRSLGHRVNEAKALADMADTQMRLGRVDEGLHTLALATALLEQCPRGNPRYVSALSSVGDAARAAELFELADEAAQAALDYFPPGSDERASAELAHAELLLEWALRLEWLDRDDEAQLRYRRVVRMVGFWVDAFAERGPEADSPLASALLALALAKTGDVARAEAIARALIAPTRRLGQWHEARLAHLAYGLVLRARGDRAAARRELLAAVELSATGLPAAQAMIFQAELAALAADGCPPEVAADLMTALRSQARRLWAVRLERMAMLRQTRRRLELEADRVRADQVASRDPLTGLGNRRAFDQRMTELSDGTAAGPLVLVLIDIDRFKSINDEHSHRVGDRVLTEVADLLRTHCRTEDVAARFGGDEFALFLAADLGTATRAAERIREAVHHRDWHGVSPGLHVTLSMGAVAHRPGMTGQQLFDEADQQLYVAKRRGRDRLSTARPLAA